MKKIWPKRDRSKYQFAYFYRNEETKKKYLARRTLRQRVRSGKVVKGLCEVCGVVKVEGHHDNYDRPLEVRWLCKKHHNEYHKMEKINQFNS